MNNLVKLLLSKLFFLLLILLVSGCNDSSRTPLRIGINAWPGYEFLYLAKVKGYYEDLGINVQLVEFGSLSDARRSFERNQIDGLATTLVEVLQSRDQSARQLTVVRAVDYSNGGDLLISSSQYKKGSDLKGARVGVELSSVGIYVLARALENFGLGLSDIDIVSSDQLTMEEEFEAGKLDAMVTYPPTSVKILRNHKSNILFTSREIPSEVIDVIAVDRSVIESRRNDVLKLLQAFDRAVQYSAENQQDAYSIMADREGISVDEFKYALENEMKMISSAEQRDYFGPGGRLHIALEKAEKILMQSKQMRKPQIQNQSDNILEMLEGSAE